MSRRQHPFKLTNCIIGYDVNEISTETRVAPDIISGPDTGRNPAKFSYPARPHMATGHEVGFDHLSMHLPHCVIGQKFIVLQIW